MTSTSPFLRPSALKQALPHHYQKGGTAVTTTTTTSPYHYNRKRKTPTRVRFEQEPMTSSFSSSESAQSYAMSIAMWIAIVCFIVFYQHNKSDNSNNSNSHNSESVRRFSHPTTRELHHVGKMIIQLEKGMYETMDEDRDDMVVHMRQLMEGEGWNPENAVHQALYWMAIHDDNDTTTTQFTTKASDFTIRHYLQRYAIAVLYFHTDVNEEWNQCSPTKNNNNNSNKPCDSVPVLSRDRHVCDWYGITCNTEKLVTRIEWTNNGLNTIANEQLAKAEGAEAGLAAVVPEELLLLRDSLEMLWWNDNPDLRLELPAWIGRMTQLQSLSMFATHLEGTLPESLWTNLLHLSSLRLYDAHLTGTLPRSIYHAHNTLSWLWIHNNQLIGSIPTEIGHLSQLEGLTLHGNPWDGTSSSMTPQAICDLREQKLEHLWTDCDDNKSCTCCTKCFEKYP